MIIININKKTSNDLKMVFRMVATEIKNLRKKSVLLLPDSVFEATSHYLHYIYKIGSKWSGVFLQLHLGDSSSATKASPMQRNSLQLNS